MACVIIIRYADAHYNLNRFLSSISFFSLKSITSNTYTSIVYPQDIIYTQVYDHIRGRTLLFSFFDRIKYSVIYHDRLCWSFSEITSFAPSFISLFRFRIVSPSIRFTDLTMSAIPSFKDSLMTPKSLNDTCFSRFFTS